MRIVTFTFDHPENQSQARGVQDGTFEQLARVFEHSAQTHMPGADFTWRRVDTPVRGGYEAAYAAKIDLWTREVAYTHEPLMLADCDMLMCGPVGDVWRYNFDIAITRRDELDGRYEYPKNVHHIDFKRWQGPPTIITPINTGVVFVRPNWESRVLFGRWRQMISQIQSDPGAYRKWLSRYKAIDQAALGYLMEEGQAKVLTLPCSTWNSCESSWGLTDARMVHIKRQLRRACLGQMPVPTRHQNLVAAWQQNLMETQ